MKSLFEIIFRSFWTFTGFLIIMSLLLSTIVIMWNRFFRHWNIRKHGYPPNTDADGDFKTDNDN